MLCVLHLTCHWVPSETFFKKKKKKKFKQVFKKCLSFFFSSFASFGSFVRNEPCEEKQREDYDEHLLACVSFYELGCENPALFTLTTQNIMINWHLSSVITDCRADGEAVKGLECLTHNKDYGLIDPFIMTATVFRFSFGSAATFVP